MLQYFLSRRRLALRLLLLVSIGFLAKRIWFHTRYSPLHTMATLRSPTDVASSLLAAKGLHLQSVEVLQSLWAGYGQICRITATPDTSANYPSPISPNSQSYILKLITPPPTKVNNEGHIRKILSYQVEKYFYIFLASQLPPSIPVAKYIASVNEAHPDGTVTTAMILSDLKQNYPIAGEKRNVLNPTQVHAALDWLSGFHGFWWPRVKEMDRRSLVRPPLQEITLDGEEAKNKTVWLNGGYTYLATRRSEYANLAQDDDAEWGEVLTDWEADEFSISELVAAVLAPKQTGWSPTQEYMTLIHGDVKSENLFTSESGEEVVFYDFQYTGLGLGVCDLAKLFTCSVPLDMLVEDGRTSLPRELPMQGGEKKLLERYWQRLRNESRKEYDWNVFVGHWETALVDWLRFQASWGFWGNTEWLEARVRSILKNETWKAVVQGNAKMAGLWERRDEIDPFVMVGGT
jgi:hypothetical protein